MSPDYKNGYNSSIERLIEILNKEISKAKDGDMSINEHLRMVRLTILRTAFTNGTIEEDKIYV